MSVCLVTLVAVQQSKQLPFALALRARLEPWRMAQGDSYALVCSIQSPISVCVCVLSRGTITAAIPIGRIFKDNSPLPGTVKPIVSTVQILALQLFAMSDVTTICSFLQLARLLGVRRRELQIPHTNQSAMQSRNIMNTGMIVCLVVLS